MNHVLDVEVNGDGLAYSDDLFGFGALLFLLLALFNGRIAVAGELIQGFEVQQIAIFSALILVFLRQLFRALPLQVY